MNDPIDSELDRARDAVHALAQHVDTAAAWDALAAAVDRGPRASLRRRVELATVLVTVVAVVGAVVYVRHSGSSHSSIVVTEPSTTTPPDACTLPSLPTPGSDHAAGGGPDLQLGGPAVTSLRGGAAQASFELDGGQFTVTPPAPGDTPLVSANQAECAALATSNSNGWSLLQSAMSYGGAAVGYGLVTIDPSLVSSAHGAEYLQGQVDQNTKVTLPKATPYQHRLAWVVVVRDVELFNGPSQPVRTGGAASTTSSPVPASYDYDVFVVDARTGTDALAYTEGQSAGEGGTVTVPAEQVSVPWTLVARSPDGYSGQITATVLPCDGYPNPVNVDRYRAAAAVLVERPVGADCGPPKQVTLLLRASEVTFDLPADIAHDPLGPNVTPPAVQPPTKSPCTPTVQNGRPVSLCVDTGPGATGGSLRTLEEFDSGSTLQVVVGSVFAVGPLHYAKQYAALAVQSSDSTVLGLIDGSVPGELNEYRAWRPGTADLLAPASRCGGANGTAQSCPPVWIVHVRVVAGSTP